MEQDLISLNSHTPGPEFHSGDQQGVHPLDFLPAREL